MSMRVARRFTTVAGAAACLAFSACASSDATNASGGAPKVTALTVTLGDSVLTVGVSAQATATAVTASGSAVTGYTVRWSTSDTTVATVSSAGLVTPRKAGTFTILAEGVGAPGQPTVAGSVSARAKWASGTWYVADSLIAAFSGTGGKMTPVPISGGRVALILGGSDSGPTGVPDLTVGCRRIPLAYLEVSATAKLSQPPGRLVETTPPQVLTFHLLTADVNGDGNADLFAGGSGCDVPRAPPEFRDTPKLLLGDGTGGFREVPLPSPVLQSHGAAIGVTRPGQPVDLMMLSGLCYYIASPSDSVAPQYRGDNWISFCASPGPFILRGRGDGTFAYDNTSLHRAVARSIVGNEAGRVLNIGGGALCDVNGDGANDLVISYKTADQQGPMGSVYLNDRTGRFLSTGIPLPPGTTAGNIFFGAYCRDLDGDGRVDVLVTHNYHPNSDWQVLRGNGDGTFVNVTTTALPGQVPGKDVRRVNFADINGDGQLDLVGEAVKWDDANVPVWLGTTTAGVYRLATLQELPQMPWDLGRGPTQVQAWNLVPIRVGSETMLVSRVERSNLDRSAFGGAIGVIPLQSAVIRLYRRAP